MPSKKASKAARRTPTAWIRAMHGVKTVLKASTHVFTVGGVIVAASPVIRGVKAAATGDFAGATDHILYDTIGAGSASGVTSATQAAKTALINVGIPVIVGIGLIWGGGQIRKRIGN